MEIKPWAAKTVWMSGMTITPQGDPDPALSSLIVRLTTRKRKCRRRYRVAKTGNGDGSWATNSPAPLAHLRAPRGLRTEPCSRAPGLGQALRRQDVGIEATVRFGAGQR
jgi:hypothetical protein